MVDPFTVSNNYYLLGVLALGASTLPDSELSPKQKEVHRWAAHGLADACYISFADQESGLGPEEMRMSTNGKHWMEVVEEWELGVDEVCHLEWENRNRKEMRRSEIMVVRMNGFSDLKLFPFYSIFVRFFY